MRFKAGDKVFQNAWNFKQVIFLEGTLEITMRLEQLIQVVQASDHPKTLPNLANVRVLEESEPLC